MESVHLKSPPSFPLPHSHGIGRNKCFHIDGSPVAVDSGVEVAFDGTYLTGATLAISSRTLQPGDTLDFAYQNDGIISNYSNGTLTLAGTATVAQYQAALQSVIFSTSSINPATRSLSIVVSDNGTLVPQLQSKSPLPTAARLTPSATTNSFTVGGVPAAVDPALTVASAETDLTGATVTIAQGTLRSGDTLSFTNQSDISGSFSAGVLTLNGTATPAQYQTALQSVGFSTTSGTDPRFLRIVVNDGTLSSNPVSKLVQVVVTPPAITASGLPTEYTPGAVGAYVDHMIEVSSFDADLTGASVAIAPVTLQPADMLEFTNQNGITGSYAGGVLTLSGAATPTQYQTALQSITFSTTSESIAPRMLSIIANDGLLQSNAANDSIDVTIAAPVITTPESNAAYTAAPRPYMSITVWL